MLPKYLGPAFLKFAAPTLTLAVLLFAPRPVHAQSADGALVIHGCPETSTFYGQSVGYTYQVCADIVFTPSGKVNATLHGTLLDPATAPSQAVIVRDFPCEYNNQSANDSQIVITPDGQVNGFCKVH